MLTKASILCMTFFTTLFSIQSANSFELPANFQAKWAGIEVMGTDLKTAQKVRELLPIPIGKTYSNTERASYRSLCNKVQDNFKEYASTCSFIFYGGKKNNTIYYVVEMIPKNSPTQLYRTIPNKNDRIPQISKNIKTLLEQVQARLSLLIATHQIPKEIHDKGFLDFDEPQLHAMCQKLSKLTYKENGKIMDILHFSPDPKEREMAAELLAWSRHPENLKSILEWDILSDPDKGVRNYAARSFIHTVSKLQDKALQTKLIFAYCKMATLPDLTDRNKSLSSLYEIINENPDLMPAIHAECRNTIEYISKHSILKNVGGIAKSIAEILDLSKRA